MEATDNSLLSKMMQTLEGQFAEDYNRRHGRSGAFWSDRFHCTMVEGDEYALNCIKYIDLNMVRAGVIRHPSEWRWCGYDELVGVRQRYRLIDMERLLYWFNGLTKQQWMNEYRLEIDEAIAQKLSQRDPVWTESIAVGSEEFVRRISDEIQHRFRLDVDEVSDGIWVVREPMVSYNAFSYPKKGF
jgi:hypothetical protein